MLSSRCATLIVSKRSGVLGVANYRSFPICRNLCFVRLTSSGPPPKSIPKSGSFTERYENFISKWPRVYALHRLVVDGSRWCFSDVKTYIRLRRELSAERKKLEELSIAELEVLVQMPFELPKVAITTVLLPLPFGFYVVGFAIILFPRFVLTRHFWTDAQRKEFFQAEVSKSMKNSSRLKELIGNPLSVEEVRFPELDHLGAYELVALAPLYSMFPFPGTGRRFKLRCKAMRQLDKVIAGHIDSLTEQQLNFHLYIRRILVPRGVSEANMRDILREWIRFTSHLEDGVYLCAPIVFNRNRSI